MINLFQKNGEKWASIQKCESKFMSKEYIVKVSEIFKIPRSTQSTISTYNENYEEISDEDAIEEVEAEISSQPTNSLDYESKAPLTQPKDDNDHVPVKTKKNRNKNISEPACTETPTQRPMRLAAR